MIPILLDKVKIPLEFRRKQTADLIAWDGDPSHGGLQGLFEALDGTRPQAPSAPTVTTSTSRPAFQFRPWLTTGGVGFVLGCFVTYLVVSGLAGQERTAFQTGAGAGGGNGVRFAAKERPDPSEPMRQNMSGSLPANLQTSDKGSFVDIVGFEWSGW